MIKFKEIQHEQLNSGFWTGVAVGTLVTGAGIIVLT